MGSGAVISHEPDIDDLVPPQALSPYVETGPEPTGGTTSDAASFPKVLRRRLENFFSDRNISPKADRTMWVKVALGFALLAGSWITLCALKPDSWKFVAVYLLGGLHL